MIKSEDGKTRFDVTLSNEKGDEVETYTWAYDYDGAVKRMQDGFAEEPNVWNGWKFTVHPVNDSEIWETKSVDNYGMSSRNYRPEVSAEHYIVEDTFRNSFWRFEIGEEELMMRFLRDDNEGPSSYKIHEIGATKEVTSRFKR